MTPTTTKTSVPQRKPNGSYVANPRQSVVAIAVSAKQREFLYKTAVAHQMTLSDLGYNGLRSNLTEDERVTFDALGAKRVILTTETQDQE